MEPTSTSYQNGRQSRMVRLQLSRGELHSVVVSDLGSDEALESRKTSSQTHESPLQGGRDAHRITDLVDRDDREGSLKSCPPRTRGKTPKCYSVHSLSSLIAQGIYRLANSTIRDLTCVQKSSELSTKKALSSLIWVFLDRCRDTGVAPG